LQIARSFVLSISTNFVEVAAGSNGLHVSSYYGTAQLSNNDHNCSPLDFAIGPRVSGSALPLGGAEPSQKSVANAFSRRGSSINGANFLLVTDSLQDYFPDVGMCLPTHMLQMMGYSQLALTVSMERPAPMR
jgi:hypothetical protein